VLRLALPSGLVIGATIFVTYVVASLEGKPTQERQTAATVGALLVALWLLGVLARPWAAWKVALLATMAGLAVLALVVPAGREYFALTIPRDLLAVTLLIAAAGAIAVELSARWARSAQ
jgi:cation-transporting ATPase E